jgi:hypothetical protein
LATNKSLSKASAKASAKKTVSSSTNAGRAIDFSKLGLVITPAGGSVRPRGPGKLDGVLAFNIEATYKNDLAAGGEEQRRTLATVEIKLTAAKTKIAGRVAQKLGGNK